MKTKTFTRTRKLSGSKCQVTQRYHAMRQDGVKAKLAEWIGDVEYRITHDTAFLVELRKIKPEDYASVVELRGAYSAALLKVD